MRRTQQLLLLVASAIPATYGADAARPRGVGPDLAKHYKDPQTFACIFNPSIQIPHARINDNYCDCPDGSDEPGTAACAHLAYHAPVLADRSAVAGANTTLALPGFYCKNKGHIPAYLPLTHVNDGICDYEVCCDGSDEHAGVGGTKCPDKCKEIGKEWRKLDEARQKSMTAALKKRQELVTESARVKQEVTDKIKDLETLIEGSRSTVAELEAKLAEAERIARGKVIKGPGGKAGRTGVLASLAKGRIEELRRGMTQLQLQRQQASNRLEELEKILTTFKEEYNPNFNDEGVKRAVRAWEDYSARDPDTAGELAEADLEEMLKLEADTGIIDWAEWERSGEDELDILYDFEAYLPPTIRTWVDEKLRALRLFLIENGIVAGSSDANSGEDPLVTTARTARDTAQNTLSQQERDLASHTEDLGRDYGADEVFRAQKGKCITKDSGEYTYELCFMDAAKQRSRKGGGETNMGNFAGLETTVVDDTLPADGKGLGSGVRVAMRHENGQGCWNGPSRSTYVVLACAEEDEIWKISEEEKCVYRMEVGSPAVCEPRAPPKKQSPEKDEL